MVSVYMHTHSILSVTNVINTNLKLKFMVDQGGMHLVVQYSDN